MSDNELTQLINGGSFLEFTRKRERDLPRSYDFELPRAHAKLADTGVLAIEPRAGSQCDIVISSGIHGDETAPMEIVDRLVREIFSGEIPVRNRVLFIIGNPAALNAGKRDIDENLNRLFCGKHKNAADTCEGKRAARLETAVANFFESGSGARYHYDLHTAIRTSKYEKFAVYPYRQDQRWDKGQLEFLHACGVDTVLLGHAPSGTFSYYSSHRFGAHAFTVELGKVMPFGANDMSKFEAITINLRRLIQGLSIATTPFENRDFHLFQVVTDLQKKSERFKLNLAPDAENFTSFAPGTVLAEDGDEQYVTSRQGESIVFPNPKVKVGQRAGLIVVPAQLQDELT